MSEIKGRGGRVGPVAAVLAVLLLVWYAAAAGLNAQGAIERVLVSGDRVGNLGSASIWVGLHLARTGGQLKDGDRVLVLGAEATKYLYGGFVYTAGGGELSAER